MPWLRRLLSGILVVLLVPVLSSLIVVSSLGGVFGLSTASAEEATAKAMAAAMKEPVVEAMTVLFSDPEEGLGLPAEEVRTVLNESLSDEQLVQFSTSYTVAMQNVSSGEGPAVVELGDLKEALLSGLRRLVEYKMATLPLCTKEQTADLASLEPDELPECRASDPAVGSALLDRFFAELRAAIPNELDLSLIGADLEDEEAMAMPATIAAVGAPAGLLTMPLQVLGFVAQWGWWSAAVLSLGLVGLNRDRWYRPFGWLGWAFLLSSATPLLVAAAAPKAFGQFTGEDALVGRIAQSLLQAPLARMQVLGLVAAGLGIACIAAALIGSRRTRT